MHAIAGWRPGRELLWLGSIAVALVAIVLEQLTHGAYERFRAFAETSPTLAFWAPPLGFAAIAWATVRYFPGAEGSGIPQVMAAAERVDVSARRPILAARVMVGKVLLTAASLGVGASAGREGPTVQVGAAIMRVFSGRVRESARLLVVAGGAAGIAAAFNTPLAGAVFAIEELAHSFEDHTHGETLRAVVGAGLVSFALLGNYAYFGTTSVGLPVGQAIAPILGCGVLGGLFGGLFARSLLAGEAWLTDGAGARAFPGGVVARHPVVRAFVLGFVVACVGLVSHAPVMGSGYAEARAILEDGVSLGAAFAPAKFVATLATYLSGVPGGLFSPSLAIGAGLGQSLAPLFPAAPVAAVVILGMTGYFTGVVQVPLTASIIVMEMTSDPSLSLPLIVTAFIAYGVSRRVAPRSLYRELAHRFLRRLDDEEAASIA